MNSSSVYPNGEGHVTGHLRNITEDAVKQFQADNNLIMTGIAGKVTRGVMIQLGCVR